MSFTEFKKTLLARIFEMLDKDGFDKIVTPALIATQTDLPFKRGWVEKALEQYEANGWAKLTRFMSGSTDDGIRMTITGAGIEEAERLYEDGWSEVVEAAAVLAATTAEMLVPAADRIVSLNDNEHAASLRATLADLEPQIAGNNELPAHDALEFERRFAEFQAGNLLVKAATASAGALATVLLGTLKWLLTKLAETAVAPLLASAIAALLALLGLSST